MTDLDPDKTKVPAGRSARLEGDPSPRRSSGAEAQSVGKYRFIAMLGHGGMADVFLAVAQGPAGFNKLLVIKRLRPSLAEDPELCAMFLDEARLAARLNHKNVVQTNEVDLVDGQYFMAMEHLDGQPLHRVLGRAKQLDREVPLPVVLRVACEALNGLHYAHDLADYDGTPLGVVHRDVSPQNVFVTYDGQVKIVDFGIAKAARRVVETDTGVIKGKLSYMAPEQAFAPSAEIDRRADVFSVGVMLWEMLAGRRLWQSMGDPEILGALTREAPRIASARPTVDPELARICDKALSLDREDRYPTAAALRADLERAGTACSAEELGDFVEGLFHAQRAEIKARIAQQVERLEHDGAGELIELDRGAMSRRTRGSSSVPPPAGGTRAGHSSIPPSAPASETPPPSTVTARRLGDSIPDEQGTLFAQHHRPRSRATAVLGGLITTAAAAALYLANASSRDVGRPAAPTGSAAGATSAAPVANTVAAATGTVPMGAYVHVHLAANPAEARILVDGAPLPSNPFDGKFVKDGAVHRLQFEAAGFLPQNRVLVFDKDQSLEVPLQPKPKVDPPGMKPDPYR
ncbi:MAG: serine/threonine-protein kinase [Minicystis sp.]